MEMGKLTAKLRDMVPVCFLVEGKEIKRYKNIEIPDELKMLEYQDFKFDVPLNGMITFKIMFEPGVLPEEFPQTRVRMKRKPIAQEVQSQDAAQVAVEAQQEPQLQDDQAAEAVPTSVSEVFVQALGDAQAAGELLGGLVVEQTDGEVTKVKFIEAEGQLVANRLEPEDIKAMSEPVEVTAVVEAQPEDSEPVKTPALKGKKRAASTKYADK